MSETKDVIDNYISVVNHVLELIKKIDVDCYIASILMFRHGLRVSEALSITGAMFDKQGKLFVKGLKNSSDRMIVDSELFELCKPRFSRSRIIDERINRFFLWRLYKKLGLSYTFLNNQRASVTHLGRHLFVASMETVVKSTEQKAKHVGHKSTKSTKTYEKKR